MQLWLDHQIDWIKKTATNAMATPTRAANAALRRGSLLRQPAAQRLPA
jgi:hypothetical protein